MKVSIVIPDKDDLLLERCINSIDEDVEVVISLNNPSQELEELVSRMLSSRNYSMLQFKVCRIDKPSIAMAYNNGIAHASYEKILLMDSDCVFERGTIVALDNVIGDNYLAKGRVVFQHNSFLTKIVSKAREYHTSDQVNAYSPPLLFRKSIISKIGGHYFNSSLCWLEDSEFDRRVQAANLHIAYQHNAVVKHQPITLGRDLRSAFWYGVGHAIGYNLDVNSRPRGFVRSVYKYIIVGSKTKGLATGLYLYGWKLVLLVGFYCQLIFRIRK